MVEMGPCLLKLAFATIVKCSFFVQKENRIGVFTRGIRVWRERGALQRLAFASEMVPYAGRNVMFWNGIMYGKSTLVQVSVKFTGQIYIHLIIRPIVQSVRVTQMWVLISYLWATILVQLKY